MILILEGVDCAGKTWMAERLLKETPNAYLIKHGNRPTEDSAAASHTLYKNYKAMLDSYELAIKRRSKIDNHEVTIPLKNAETEVDEEQEAEEDVPVKAETGEVNKQELATEKKNGEAIEGEVVDEEKKEELAFKGYATVIPIRGKESSLDYYLMVLSSEVFT